MKPINLILLVVALAGAAATASGAAPDDGGKSLYARVTERARELAGEDYTAPDPNQLPGALRDLNYQQYREIRFNKDHALWRGQDLFEVE
ncbi:MAG: glucan biosynthesis protein, partial [Ectothiorhodospiraceae bacterium]